MQDNISIMYEDDFIILVNKPSGVPSHMLKPDEKGTVVNFLLDHYPSIKGIGTSELMSGLVHRLDTDTSGTLLSAKDNKTFANLRKQFKEHKILKEYKTLVHGKYTGPLIINNYTAPDPKNKKKVKVFSSFVKGSRPAVTEIMKKKFYKNYTFLTVKIKTGVRHQIRAHLANLGHPIVGDLLYQNLKTRKKNQLELKHHFLHAWKLGFYHPNINKWMELESQLPKELNEILNRLSKG